ncbi:unnamed protein product [Aphanomyces euteiches]|uniref:FYVE-type domain-containing protein n=1 Tax=Aphanomyces euteiches TaxID=100861 RepID=A0A6G0WKZ5_9STRA|nr:hypothetical protein Ae201684_014057 [Aphanomyces euteiches]KAH9096263.1 hypothetical protein Ae201684P_009497 [Aphanomyces euteiches]KAH9133927.1 hypothetical protein AeRB84_020153 [Aphanomyces euteiches]
MLHKLPLPANFFKTPQLTPERKSSLDKLARRNARNLVLHAQLSHGPVHWTLLSEHHGFCIYRGSEVNAASNLATYCSTIQVRGTIEEVAALFNPQTSPPTAPSLERIVPMRFLPTVLDQATLLTLALPSTSQPRHYRGIHWTAFQSPSRIAKSRDCCFLETHMDAQCDGRRGWVRATTSVEMPECPDLPQYGLVRMDFQRCGHVVFESLDRPGYLDVLYMTQVDLKGSVPDFVTELAMRRICKGLRDLHKAMSARRLLSQGTELILHGARTCAMCATLFVYGADKIHCRFCNHVVCKPCSTHWVLPGLHVNVCKHCAQEKTSAPPSSQPIMDRNVRRSLPSLIPEEDSPRSEVASRSEVIG